MSTVLKRVNAVKLFAIFAALLFIVLAVILFSSDKREYDLDYPTTGIRALDKQIEAAVDEQVNEFNKAFSRRDAVKLTVSSRYSEFDKYFSLELNIRYGENAKTARYCFLTKNGKTVTGETVFGESYREYLSNFFEKSRVGSQVLPQLLTAEKSNFNDFFVNSDGSATFYFNSDSASAAAEVLVDAATLAGERFSTRTVDTGKPMVALTFDDGPHNVHGNRILDCLEANGAVATFYEIGVNVDEFPEVDERAVSIGCEVGAHSYNHKVLKSLTPEELEADKAMTEQAFINAIGYVPATIRPPQGEIVKSVMNQYDQVFVGWSVDTEDWISRDPERIFNKVKNAGDLNGQVILMHSIYEESAAAAEMIVPWLIEQGYELVTVSELFEYHFQIEPLLHCYYQYDYFATDGAFDVNVY